MQETGFTLKFSNNPNMKLYGKYFVVIRPENHFADNGIMVEIELAGKIIMCARVLTCEVVKFSEIPPAYITLDTGLNYSSSLLVYREMGINVEKLDTKVKIMLIETIDYTKPKP